MAEIVKRAFECGCMGSQRFKNKELYKIDRYFARRCSDCERKHREEEIRKANEIAVNKTKELGLIELEGTEKQVTWANTIRIGFIETWNNELAEKAYANMMLVVEKQTEAKFYIDNQSKLKDLEYIENCAREFKN